jgi:hypothetical protein
MTACSEKEAGGSRVAIGTSVSLSQRDFDDAAPHEKERRPGRPLLVDIFAVPVVPLVRAAGEPRQVRAAEFLEEIGLPQEVDEVMASLARRLRGRQRPERRERRTSRDIRRIRVRGPLQQDLPQAPQGEPVLHRPDLAAKIEDHITSPDS